MTELGGVEGEEILTTTACTRLIYGHVLHLPDNGHAYVQSPKGLHANDSRVLGKAA